MTVPAGLLVHVMVALDRHLPCPSVFPFGERDEAVAAARRWAYVNAACMDHVVELEPGPGQLVWLRYAPEGDAVWVVSRVLDGPVTEGWRGV